MFYMEIEHATKFIVDKGIGNDNIFNEKYRKNVTNINTSFPAS